MSSITIPSSNWQKLKNKIAQEDAKKAKDKKRKRVEITQKPVKSIKSSYQQTASNGTNGKEINKNLFKKDEIWFDVKEDDLDRAYGKVDSNSSNGSVNSERLAHGNKAKIGKYIAIDCEMVGVGPGGESSALARVTVVNYHGVVILDKYVRPVERVTDFRSEISGITPKLLAKSHEFKQVQREVADVIKDRIVIGHALHHDFRVLLLDHPRKMMRDTSLYNPFRKLAKGKTPSLKRLAKEELGITIQEGCHSSVEDAQVCMMLYRKHRSQWEQLNHTRS
ncbi:11859_t:CDS:2 [Acaulospora morrowiae]|uniref:RNA exonuclease 4 n=1 Tax=Acaulospora morrowiae TaxID=94023 RepID=A0A9N9AZ84_9GLOM|nr:11859_t:CDS:2 [Acaulospora morrowiae]